MLANAATLVDVNGVPFSASNPMPVAPKFIYEGVLELGALMLEDAETDARAKIAALSAIVPGDYGLGVSDPVTRAALLAILGATDGAAVVTDANGTQQQYLRGLVKMLAVLGASNGAAVVTDADGTAQQYLRGIVKTLAAGTGFVQTKIAAGVAASYRANVVAADVIAAPGTVTCTLVAGGSLAASAHTIFVVAGNIYGRTTAKQGNATVTGDGGANKTARAALAAVTGATFYDIYCSTDGVAAKWVGRVTEAQRTSGIKITAVGVYGAGGTPGAVDIEIPGTGLAVNAGQLVQNTAYVIPASPVDCTGHQYVDFDLSVSRTGDAAAMALAVIPFFLNARTTTCQAGDLQTLNFGGTIGAYWPNKQRMRVEARGNAGVALVVASIAGTGASLDIDATLN